VREKQAEEIDADVVYSGGKHSLSSCKRPIRDERKAAKQEAMRRKRT